MLNAVLTTNEVQQLAGIPLTTLQKWVDEGIVPVLDRGGQGRGHTRQFDWLGALAAAYGMKHLQVGWNGERARAAASFVANLGGDGLRQALKEAKEKGHNWIVASPALDGSGGLELFSSQIPEDIERGLNLRYANLLYCVDEVLDGIERLKTSKKTVK